jgi:hypothetical protein
VKLRVVWLHRRDSSRKLPATIVVGMLCRGRAQFAGLRLSCAIRGFMIGEFRCAHGSSSFNLVRFAGKAARTFQML